MDDLKKVIEDRLLDSEPMQGLFPEGPGKAETLDAYINVDSLIYEMGERYDVHKCYITVKRDKFNLVQAFNIIEGMKSLEEPWGIHYDDPYPHILKAIWTKIDHKEDGGFVIHYDIINTIER